MSDYSLPKLPYDLSGLEPVLSKDLVDLHYNKHHKKYVDELNKAIGELKEALPKKDLVKILQLQTAIAFNGGGHINHCLYWENLSPVKEEGGKLPAEDSPFYKQIIHDWGSFDALKEYFSKKTAEIHGSGWGWLVFDKAVKKTAYEESSDQDNIMMLKPDKIPLLVIDIWEHAFYVDYKNVKMDYLKNIWKIVNWKVAQERFMKATH